MMTDSFAKVSGCLLLYNLFLIQYNKMMIRCIFCLLLCAVSPLAVAETHGYLGFWHNPNDPLTVPETKTTQENNNREDARAEIEQFCSEQDKSLKNGQSGCFSITPLHDTCAAVAWSRKRGLMSPDNIVISIHPKFQKVAKLASKACRKQFGWFARCEIETVYCTDKQMYE